MRILATARCRNGVLRLIVRSPAPGRNFEGMAQKGRIGHTSNLAYTVPILASYRVLQQFINFIDPSGLQSCETQTSRAVLCKTGQEYLCEVERLAVWPMERELVTCWLILGWHARDGVGSCCWHLCTVCQHREGKTRAISAGIFGPIKGHG